VTGRLVAPTAASIKRSAWSRLRIRAEPDWPPVTSLAGQPKFRSMMSAPAASARRAPSAIQRDSRPTSWITVRGSPSPTAARRTTSRRPAASSSEATISVAT
jgi:hypothetical protein